MMTGTMTLNASTPPRILDNHPEQKTASTMMKALTMLIDQKIVLRYRFRLSSSV